MREVRPGITEHYLSEIDLTTGTAEDERVFCGFNLTDMGNAERLVGLYGDRIRYCAERKTWYLWDGIRWAPDTTNRIQELAKKTVRLIHAETVFMTNASKDQRQNVTRWAYQSEAHVRVNAMIRNAESDERITVEASDFDAKLQLINCPNGTLDLERREFREHRREDMLTKLTKAPYDPWRRCKSFFPTLMRALPPLEVIYGQRELGSMLEPTTQLKEWLFIYGMPFALKSSVTQPVYAALGDYAGTFDISLLTKSKHGIAANAARPELIALEGLRIAWSEEAPPNFIIDDVMLKSLTSSGRKSTRQIFEKQRELQLICSFVLESNGAFTIDIEDEWSRDAAMERTRVMKFVNQIPESERDPSKLIALTTDEDELTAALAWVIQGYFDRKDYDLDVPASIKETSEEFQTAVNPLNSFVKNEVIFDDGTDEDGALKFEVRTFVSDLYQRFQEIADPETVKLFKNARSFNTQFRKIVPYYAKKAGVEIKSHKFKTGAAWLNVRLAEVSDDPDIDTSCSEGDAKGDEVTQKCRFGYTNYNLAKLHEDFYQKGVLHHLPTFPTILIEGLEPKEIIISSNGLQNDEEKKVTQNIAKPEDIKHGDDTALGVTGVTPQSHHQPGKADFEKYITNTLEALASSATSHFEPGVLLNETVNQFCADRDIDTDRQARLILAHRFREFVNGEAAHLFLRVTGGQPLLLAG